jgi:glucuronoarabinoxylan endo-1,4-beta-xylanase
MRKLALLAMLVLCAPFVAHAAGGTCPTGANYVNPSNPTGSLVILASLGITNGCYYVAANGSDSNDGLSEASGHPWLHAPMMPNCSSNCLTLQNTFTNQTAAGIGIILRGRDTWHLGNSGASPYTGGTWEFNQYPGAYVEGTASHPFYAGYDVSWFSGSSFARPILSGDNPLCNTGNANGTTCVSWTDQYGQPRTYVSSCSYQVGSPNNNFVDFTSLQYIIFDNFEMTGLCQNHLTSGTPPNANPPFGADTYVKYSGAVGPLYFQNLYIHGASHIQFSGYVSSGLCAGNNAGESCLNTFVFIGSATGGDTLDFNVVDFSDSDNAGVGLCYGGLYNAAYNAFRYTVDCVPGLHSFHDNLYEYFFEDGHSNVLETDDVPATNAFYNNVFRHIETNVTSGGGVFLWFGPGTGATDYIFNNVGYDVGALEYLNNGGVATTTVEGNYVWFNNTWQSNANQPILRCTGYTNGTIADTNDHYIDDGTYLLGPCSTLTTTTPLSMTNATATSDGYTSSQTYAYSPTSAGSPTVGSGTSEGYCSTLSGSSDSLIQAAGAACGSDTRYGMVYNSTTHTVTYPGRTSVTRASPPDIGAYQESGGSTPTSTINWTDQHQQIDGFGASTGYQERNNNMSAAQADCYFLASSNGSCANSPSIGLEWIRIQDNGSTSSAPDLTTLQEAVARGAQVFITFETLANSSAYASEIVSKILYLQSNGVPIAYLSPANEPGGEGVTASEFDSFIVTYLHPALAAASLSTPIIIPENAFWFDSSSDCSNFSQTCYDWITPCMNDSSCSPYVPIVNGHGYTAVTTSQYFPGDWAACCAIYPNNPPPSSIGSRHVWMTEIAGGYSGPCASYSGEATYDPSMTDALVWARNINDLLTVGNGSAWMYWNLAAETHFGSPDCNDGLASSTFVPAQRFYVVGNWSKFVRSGYYRIDSTVNPQSGVYITAFQNTATGALVIVAVNTNGSTAAQNFSVTNAPNFTSVTPYVTSSSLNLAAQSSVSVSSNAFSYTLPADSVTTFVGTEATANAPSCTPAGGVFASPTSTTCTDSSSGAVMCYTLNGATPATNGGTGCTTGNLYSGAISITATETLKIIAGGTGYFDSMVVPYSFTITSNIPSSPSPKNFVQNGYHWKCQCPTKVTTKWWCTCTVTIAAMGE